VHWHHFSIRCANIFRSIAFYEQLGFEVEVRFSAGIALACWLQGSGGRLELLQVPDPQEPPDSFGDPHYVGYYHVALQVDNLEKMLASLTGTTLLLPPKEQWIGAKAYRIAFIADPDGLPIELIEER
jgi:catechol 2,3-dioxygenase-like lactoylglutathione lyase family enzyme